MKKLFATLYLFFGLFIFFGFMLIVLPFIIGLSFLPGKIGASAAFLFLKIWSYAITIFSGFPVIVHRNKNLRKDQAYIYVSNHNSYLDSPAVVIAAQNAFKPLGKIEMTKIPVFGWIYKRVVVLIDRSSKESRAESVLELKKVLDQGTSVLIFPEGTMNTSDEPLKEFYDGAFRIAIETKSTIAPFVIINARKLLPRKNPMSIKPGVIHVYFADPIDASNYNENQLQELKELVYQEMQKLIIKHQK